MADARFEEAVAEERERSAEERSTEEQEHERCADGERAMAIVEIGSKFKYQGQEVVVKTKDVRSEHSFMCKVPGRRAHKPFGAVWIRGRQAKMVTGEELSDDESVESSVEESSGGPSPPRRSMRLDVTKSRAGGVGFRSPGRDAAIAALGQSVGALGLGGALAGMQEAISARCEEEEGGGGDDGSEYSEGGGDGGSEYREGSGDRRPRLTPAAPAAANRRRQQPPPQGAGGVGAAVADALAPFLVKHRLEGAATALRELGAESPADLLDLEEADIAGLELKKLELTRFERAVDGLRGRQPAPGSQVAPPATPESLEARGARERRDAHLRAGLATDLGLRARAAVATRAEAGGGAAAATRAVEVVVRSVTDQEFVANPSAHMAAARACLEPRDATNLG